MKKGGILNSRICSIIGSLGHGDIIAISDAGMPVPAGTELVDLAITADVPDLITVLEPLMNELIYERVVVAAEQKENNPLLYSKISSYITRCGITLVPHAEILSDVIPKVKAVIRTGAFEPWGNIFITSGIDAPAWFSKQSVITPSEYKERASYKEDV